MQTHFSEAQRADPRIAEADGILRSCVHCGFCNATCPTYVLLGDERDSPRGRIYLIKSMLEGGREPSTATVTHIDRCLSCLACMTTCPSGVNYMRLVDHARRHIEERYRRPAAERLMRSALALVLPRRTLFRIALRAAKLARPVTARLPGRLGSMAALAATPVHRPSSVDRPQSFAAQGARRRRVALLSGCLQPALAPAINEATVRLLTRLGCEVVVARGAGCCGALTHHLGREAAALSSAKANVRAWTAELEGAGLDAVVVNASGCGTMVKDYGYLLRQDPEWALPAARIAALATDICELVRDLGLEGGGRAPALTVAYHSACSLQHGQKVTAEPVALLGQAGFAVREVAEGHLCCGSAGSYNLLQPELAGRLLERKVANIEATGAAVVAAGNIGCMVQIARGTELPVVHTVELLDWATGGPRPPALKPDPFALGALGAATAAP
ncbi:MAG: glycolate oxidase subunit GlcF [Alphaproteobacteria bacterium]